MVDCSHANSNKDHTLQPRVIENIAEQIADGNRSIIGLMMESNLEAGNQKMTPSGKNLQYGVSVTDVNKDNKFDFVVTGFGFKNLALTYKDG